MNKGNTQRNVNSDNHTSESTALIVVDVQNGFITPETEHVVYKIRDLITHNDFDYVVATEFINVDNSLFERQVNYSGMKDLPETLVDDIIADNVDIIIPKTAYSPQQDLIELLHDNNISRVIIVGIDTDACVLATAFSTFDNNIETFILEDCCASTGGNEVHIAALRVMRHSFGRDHVIFDMQSL